MPYINESKRNHIDPHITTLLRAAKEFEGDPGVANYIITTFVLEYFRLHPYSRSYSLINTAIGVLACVTQELYRRVAIPYENQKKVQNGDVFDDEEQLS